MATKKEKVEKVVKFTVDSVYVGAGLTLNMGEYESARIDTGITLRSHVQSMSEHDRETLKNEMLEYGWREVRADIKARAKEIREGRAKRGN